VEGVMLKGLLGILPFLPICAVAMAQGPASVEAPTTHTSLWVAESDSVTLYLLGSVHILRESDFPLHPRMESAFEQADLVLFEAPIDSIGDASAAPRMLEVAMLPEGTSLDEVVPEKTFRRAEAAARELGIDPTVIRPMRPAMVAMLLTLLEYENAGFTEMGIDLHFYRRAVEKGVPVGYFETVAEQLDIIFDSTPELAAQFLDATLEQLESSEDEIARLMDAWKNGDHEALDRLLNETMEGLPELRNRLLIDRNHRWAERLEPWLKKDQDVLIVVGAGHLPGDEGLIRLLEKRGFRIRQL
jgi:uncharacterized protein YbaP (TraB family)